MSVFEVFGLFYKTALRIFPFFHDFRGQWGTAFGPDGFSEKILNPGLKGIKCPFLRVLAFLQNGSKDLLNFLHDYRGLRRII